MKIGTQNANVINNGNKFKPFQIGYYTDFQDLVNQLQEQIDDENYNPSNICVCIGYNTPENIDAQKQMFKD